MCELGLGSVGSHEQWVSFDSVLVHGGCRMKQVSLKCVSTLGRVLHESFWHEALLAFAVMRCTVLRWTTLRQTFWHEALWYMAILAQDLVARGLVAHGRHAQ